MIEVKWNEKARLHMIEKSEFYYDSEKIYQFGYYDGYHRALEDIKAKKILEMLQRLTEVCDIKELSEESNHLIRQLTVL